MKTITITMTDEVYLEVLENVMVRRMVGDGHGIMDMAMLRIVEGIKNGEDAVALAFKNEKEDN